MATVLSLDDVSADFTRSLASAIAWARMCVVLKADPSTLRSNAQVRAYMSSVFRTAVVTPPAHRLTGNGDVDLYHPEGTFDDVRRDVWRVVAEREQQLAQLGVTLPRHDSAFRLLDEHKGALIAYYPERNLCDGAAPASSDDFFDGNNVPPWDLWIDLLHMPDGRGHEMVLVSWVPPGFVELAHAGIDVNPEECIVRARL